MAMFHADPEELRAEAGRVANDCEQITTQLNAFKGRVDTLTSGAFKTGMASAALMASGTALQVALAAAVAAMQPFSMNIQTIASVVDDTDAQLAGGIGA